MLMLNQITTKNPKLAPIKVRYYLEATKDGECCYTQNSNVLEIKDAMFSPYCLCLANQLKAYTLGRMKDTIVDLNALKRPENFELAE
jgi:hypothetical protein